jgi:hypothetical protein
MAVDSTIAAWPPGRLQRLALPLMRASWATSLRKTTIERLM